MERERGLALVSVLWAVSILSLIAASMISTGSVSTLIGRNALKRVQADTIAQSAIALGVLGLIDPRSERRWRVDGVPRMVEFEGTPIEIALQDELGLIDLNEADASTLARLFQSAGVDERTAARLSANVSVWRISTTRTITEGATAQDYHDAGLPYAPRRAPFQSVDELKLVLGMTPTIFDRIEPALTVYSRQPSVDQRVAPREALHALPGMDERLVERILAERRSSSGTMGSQGLPLGAGVVDPSLAQAGRVFSIRAAFTYRGTMFEKKAVVRLSSDPMRPYALLSLE